ncbi:MAG TPA: methyltransferase domain-containing protein [Acidimicrobiales bacterium]|nr:methyltransferase domain-containing protein [Acidimicrobiales bacterium]
MSTTTPVFDAAAYKATTRDQWEQAAEAWHRWSPVLEAWLGEATETMLDLAGIGAGSKVLDVAAGAGGQSLAAARRVGPTGAVLATDVSPAILRFAEAEALRVGFRNVAVREMDGEHLSVDPSFYDAAISRVGLIYFPDQQAALAGILRALRPGGKFATVTYSTPDNNRFFSVPVAIIRERARLAPPLPGQPGPFSLGAIGVLEAALVQAGFVDVEVATVAAPLRLRSAAECVNFERESFGALHQMLSGLDNPDREAAWAEITDQLGQFEGPDGFVGPCELRVAAGRRPE